MRSILKTISFFALLAAGMTVSATPLAAQCNPFISVDIYNDEWFDAGGIDAFMWSDFEDNSTLCACTDSLYQSVSWMELPNGTYWNNAENGLTSFLSGATEGVDGEYWSLGIATFDSSCYGEVYIGTPWTQIIPPAPKINSPDGIVDYLTRSSTVYQGNSSYFEIYGAALTEWGLDPMPTVAGDGEVIINSVSYVSDGQVNVSYTVLAQATPGPHILTLQTTQDPPAQGTVIVAAPTMSCIPEEATRGGTVSCSVTGAPGSVTGWSFTGSFGEGTSTGAGATTWAGPLAVSGTVTALVSGYGNLTDGVVAFPRGGWQSQPVSPSIVFNGTNGLCVLPEPPLPGGCGIGPGFSGLGLSGLLIYPPVFSGTVIPVGGPNAGFEYYATQINFTTGFLSEINPDLLNQTSTFSTHQCGATGPTDPSPNPNGFISWTNLLTQTQRHEYNDPNQSHWAFYANALNQNNPGTYFEARVAQNYASFNTDTQAQVNALIANIQTGMAVEPFAVNQSPTGQFLGLINYAQPNYTPCN